MRINRKDMEDLIEATIIVAETDDDEVFDGAFDKAIFISDNIAMMAHGDKHKGYNFRNLVDCLYGILGIGDRNDHAPLYTLLESLGYEIWDGN